MTIGFIIDKNTKEEDIEKIKELYNVENIEVITVDIRNNAEKNDLFIYKNITKQAARSFIVNNSTKDYIMFPDPSINSNVFFEDITEDLKENGEDLFIFDYENFCLENLLFKKEILKDVYFYNREILLNQDVEKVIDIALFFYCVLKCSSLRITERYFLYSDTIIKEQINSKEEMCKSLKAIKQLSDKIFDKYFFNMNEEENIQIYKMFYEKLADLKNDNISVEDFIACLFFVLDESWYHYRDKKYYIKDVINIFKDNEHILDELKVFKEWDNKIYKFIDNKMEVFLES